MFQVECTGDNNSNMVKRIEFFKGKDKKILENAIKSTFNIPTSLYYGYVFIDVKEIKMKDLPEIITVKINMKKK